MCFAGLGSSALTTGYKLGNPPSPGGYQCALGLFHFREYQTAASGTRFKPWSLLFVGVDPLQAAA